MRREKEMKRNEKRLTKAICCGLAALCLFWAFPAQVKAVPLSSNPSGTSLPAGGDSNGGAEGGGEEAQQAGGEVQQPDGGAAPVETVTSATVTASSVNVRSDAGTNASKVGSVTRGMELTVTGEKNDDSGTTWYAISYESNGGTVQGYIRSDMVEPHMTVIEPEPVETVPVETQAETQESETPPPANDYYVSYEDDGSGSSAWYLYDNVMGTRYGIANLLDAEQINKNNQSLMEEQTGRLRLVIIIMAVVILVLIVAVTVFIIKLRGAYDSDDDYEDDEDDDEDDEEEDDEEEEDERPRRRFFSRRGSRDDEDDEEERRPSRRSASRKVKAKKSSRRSRYEEDDDEEDEEDEEEEERPRRSKSSKSKGEKNWQSKNFLNDDDLEFEFLDLK